MPTLTPALTSQVVEASAAAIKTAVETVASCALVIGTDQIERVFAIGVEATDGSGDLAHSVGGTVQWGAARASLDSAQWVRDVGDSTAHPVAGTEVSTGRWAMDVRVASTAGLTPPTGATITGDNAAHALGALTGAALVVIAASGGTVRVGSASSLPASNAGFPVLSGASYDWQALAIEDVRIYVPTGATAIWGAHQ